MTLKNKHSDNGRPAVSAAGFFTTRKRLKVILIAGLMIVSLLSGVTGGYCLEGNSRLRDAVKVKKVDDGDTITVRTGGRTERVRLIGIDAPEMGQEPWGNRAKERLKAFLSSSVNIVMEYDVERRDKYGRILAYIKTNEGKMVNTEMLKAGYAVLFTFPPNIKHAGEFTDAQRQARVKRLGIWAEKGLRQLPAAFRKAHPRRN